jgi:hypothetical protein
VTWPGPLSCDVARAHNPTTMFCTEMTFGELQKLSGNDNRVYEVVRGVLHDVAVFVEKLADFLIDTGHTLSKMMEKTLHFNDSHRDLMREQGCIKKVRMGLGVITRVIGILREKSDHLDGAPPS